MLKPITNENSQKLLKKIGIKKPNKKSEYKTFINKLENALKKYEKHYKNNVDNMLYKVEGINDYHFKKLKEKIKLEYKNTTKKEMDHILNGILRSVHKLEREIKKY